MSGKAGRVTIQQGERKIIIEGPPDFVQKQVEFFNLQSDNSKLQVKQASAELPQTRIAVPSGMERDLVVQKQPKGHHETIAVLAFALKEAGVEEFSEDEIRRAYIRAVIRPPKVVGQAIRDAKNRFDFIEPGSKRGMYRLSQHGERTVMFDLPRR